jgi:hypothetical protein
LLTEVLFAVERIRGNVSVFAESESALENALGRVTIREMRAGEYITLAAVDKRFSELFRSFTGFASGFTIVADV